MSREIALTRGYVAIVDEGDFDWLREHKWMAQVPARGRTAVYASRAVAGRKGFKIMMHREIIQKREQFLLWILIRYYMWLIDLQILSQVVQ